MSGLGDAPNGYSANAGLNWGNSNPGNTRIFIGSNGSIFGPPGYGRPIADGIFNQCACFRPIRMLAYFGQMIQFRENAAGAKPRAMNTFHA